MSVLIFHRRASIRLSYIPLGGRRAETGALKHKRVGVRPLQNYVGNVVSV